MGYFLRPLWVLPSFDTLVTTVHIRVLFNETSRREDPDEELGVLQRTQRQAASTFILPEHKDLKEFKRLLGRYHNIDDEYFFITA